MTSIPHDALIVVADGTGARFFRNTGDEQALQLKAAGTFDGKDLAADGPAGMRPPEQSVNETDEATFVKQLAGEINRRALKHDFAALVLAADPQSLGQIRPLLHKEVHSRMVAEIAKTYTNASVAELQKVLG